MRPASLEGPARLFTRLARQAGRGERGAAAAEFALLAPVFGLVFAGVSDCGGALFVKFNLSGGVSSAANYALVNASSITSGGATTLATNLGNILTSSRASNWANAVVVINNSITRTVTNGLVTTTGTAANADSCYCPTVSGSTIAWGNTATCGSACANGSIAGKFVHLTASRTYNAMFASYGLVRNGAVSSSTVIQTQ